MTAEGNTRTNGPAPAANPTSPVRRLGYAVVLVALAFSQAGDRMVADTKFDLLTDPAGFLAKGLRLWDPLGAFGQVPNQAYGYLWPMGPLFVLADWVSFPPWAVQRLWWALLLLLAFFGMLRLLERLRLGSPATQAVACAAYVLTPRISSLIGGVSVEIWPMAIAPWVLLPLVRGSAQGSVRRAAALSALAVACAGGVNAVAVSAVLPLGVVWILTRAPGPRKWRLLAWWTGLTVLATFWWSGPLLLMGRFSPPFLDYIENAGITTAPSDMVRSLLGVSDWVGYFSSYDFPAGHLLVSTPFLLIDAAAVAAVGLLGMALRDNPHRRFLVLGLLIGLVLVGMGYARDFHGFFALDRQQALDHALAPLRNVHKFDVVLRIPLVLGLAHALDRIPGHLRGTSAVPALRIFRAATVLALAGLLVPWLAGGIAPSNPVQQVPGYWYDAARYLAAHDDGTTALELPAASFGDYTWGNVHDDVMQGLARSPWAARNVVPLAQPGNVMLLDAMTRVTESGRPSDTLARTLAANGVGRLLVRNDLNLAQSGAPAPAYLRSALVGSPGLRLVRSFGPVVGSPAYSFADDAKHTRIIAGRGISAATRALDVYEVLHASFASVSSNGQVLVGDPGTGIDAGMGEAPARPRVLAEDANGDQTGQVLTDGSERRETNFPAVRRNQSSTMTPRAPFRLSGKEHTRRVLVDEARWATTEVWTGGVRSTAASSSQAYADATPPLAIGEGPSAALDGDPATGWMSAGNLTPIGQWWQVDLSSATAVPRVTVRLAAQSTAVQRLRISAGQVSRVVPAPAPGATATYRLGASAASFLRVRAVGTDLGLPDAFGIAEVRVPGLRPQRWLGLPAPLPRPRVDYVSLTRDPEQAACVQVEDAFRCDDSLRSRGEDGDTLARTFAADARYRLHATASLRRSPASWRALERGTGIRVSATGGPGTAQVDDRDLAEAPDAMADGDSGTTWIASDAHPSIRVRMDRPRRLLGLRLVLDPGAAGSLPARILVRAGDRARVVDLDASGAGLLPGWRTRSFRVSVQTTRPAFSDTGNGFVETPPAVSEIRVNGSPLSDPVRQVVVGCNDGPRITVGGRILRTSLTGKVRDLVRGGSVTLRPCGGPRLRLTGPTDLLAAPRGAFRVDTVALVRPTGVPPLAEPVDVRRDQHGSPRAVGVPDRRATSLLTLNQNLNDGWTAELSGRTLPVQRVDGWKQGWVLPAGPAGTVRLAYTPTRSFNLVLQGGCLLVLLVLLAATPIRLRRRAPELPPLRAGEPGALDVAVVATAGALLTGFVGVVMMAGAAIGARRLRFTGWPGAAASALMLAGVGLVWSPIEDQSWKLAWTQLWSMAALACVVASLVPRGALLARKPDPPALAGEALEAPTRDDGPSGAGGRGEVVRTGPTVPTKEDSGVTGR